jgi:TonB family protein
LPVVPLSRWALAALLAILAGCAAESAPCRVDEDPCLGSLTEDAVPTYYEAHEVDVPARPVAPIRPGYPPQLRALGMEGEVEARVIVLCDGSVGGAQLVESTHDDFTISVQEALREARFHPALLRGKAVASWVTVVLHFRLPK